MNAAQSRTNQPSWVPQSKFGAGWVPKASTTVQRAAPKPKLQQTIYQGTYLGHEVRKFNGSAQQCCQDAVVERLETMNATKGASKKKLSSVTVATDSTALSFQVGSSGAARFNIEVKDIACVALSPKREGGALKIVSVLCRAPQRRASGPKKKGHKRGGLDLICHIWRPKDTATMWDFYLAFEKLLQMKSGVDDPYMMLAKSGKTRDATDSNAIEFDIAELAELARPQTTTHKTEGKAQGKTSDPYLSSSQKQNNSRQNAPSNTGRGGGSAANLFDHFCSPGVNANTKLEQALEAKREARQKLLDRKGSGSLRKIKVLARKDSDLQLDFGDSDAEATDSEEA